MSIKSRDAPDRYSVAAVDRALDLIEALREIGPASLAELAAACGCTRPAAFRLLRTLRARGYAIQDGARGIWRIGARFDALAHAGEQQLALVALAQPLLREAAAQIEEHLLLLRRVGPDAEVSALFPGPAGLRRFVEPGIRLPLHAGPCRLLLAHAPAAVQARILAAPLARPARHSRVDRAWLLAELARLRARTAAHAGVMEDEELVDGAGSVAVAVFGPGAGSERRVVALLCVISASFRLRGPRRREIAAVLRATAAQLGKALEGAAR